MKIHRAFGLQVELDAVPKNFDDGGTGRSVTSHGGVFLLWLSLAMRSDTRSGVSFRLGLRLTAAGRGTEGGKREPDSHALAMGKGSLLARFDACC